MNEDEDEDIDEDEEDEGPSREELIARILADFAKRPGLMSVMMPHKKGDIFIKKEDLEGLNQLKGMIRTIIRYTDNKVLLNDAEVFETSKQLLPGMYDMEFDEYGRFKNFVSLSIPKAYSLMPSTELINIQEYLKKFLSHEYGVLCEKTKILRKTGVLLYGDAGIGKSNYVNHILQEVVESNEACIFIVDSQQKLGAIMKKLAELRAIQKNLFIVVFEEIDEMLSERGTEAILKNFMDGINSVDNLLFLATTNYIECVPKSLRERPSRFKKVFEIKPSPDAEVMKAWLKETYRVFIPELTEHECEMLHEKCLNRTIDEIKHVLIDYKMDIKNVTKPTKVGFKSTRV